MPLPFILGGIAAAAGIAGVGSGISGAVKMKEANDKIKLAKNQYEKSYSRLEYKSKITSETMDELGEIELRILESFKRFSYTIEKIHNRPKFVKYNKSNIKVPQYNKEELENVAIGAGVLLGGLGGAGMGAAGGFAAAGAVQSAVMVLGVASTGTPIAELGGIAATNAALAALGGGSLAAGGGGMALGSAILGASTLGISLLIGGVIFNVVGGKISDNADKACNQMKEADEKIKIACTHLENLYDLAHKYIEAIDNVRKEYNKNFRYIWDVINKNNKTDWSKFTEKEKIATQNTLLIVGLLYDMCKVNLVINFKNNNEIGTINETVVISAINSSKVVLENLAGI